MVNVVKSLIWYQNTVEHRFKRSYWLIESICNFININDTHMDYAISNKYYKPFTRLSTIKLMNKYFPLQYFRNEMVLLFHFIIIYYNFVLIG